MLISMHIDTLYLYVWYSTYKSRDNVITARHLEVVLFNANVGTLSLFPNHYNAWLWKWMKYLNFILYRSFRSTNTSQFTDHVANSLYKYLGFTIKSRLYLFVVAVLERGAVSGRSVGKRLSQDSPRLPPLQWDSLLLPRCHRLTHLTI